MDQYSRTKCKKVERTSLFPQMALNWWCSNHQSKCSSRVGRPRPTWS